MNEQDKKLALQWLIKGYDIITVAQHFQMHAEELKSHLNTEK